MTRMPAWPAIQVRQPGNARDPGAVAHLAVAVIGWRPRAGRDLADRVLDLVGDDHAHGIAQPPGPGGQPLQELVRAAAGVGPDQHLSHRHLSGLTITHRWGGPFSVTMDLTPALGYLGQDRAAVYGLGCIGHGVAISYRNGQVLADLLTCEGAGEPTRQCPFVNWRVICCPPEPAATAAKYAICGYLQAEDAFHELVPARTTSATGPPDHASCEERGTAGQATSARRSVRYGCLH
jgi:hypothetical protein